MSAKRNIDSIETRLPASTRYLIQPHSGLTVEFRPCYPIRTMCGPAFPGSAIRNLRPASVHACWEAILHIVIANGAYNELSNDYTLVNKRNNL